MGFRDLERADQLIADAAKYRAWKQKSTNEKQAAYDTLNVDRFTYEKQIIYVAPFGLEGRNLFVEVKGPKASQNKPTPELLTLLVGYFEATAPTGAEVSIVKPTYFPISKLAKLSLKLRVTTATTKDDSRITGRKYYRHKTNSASMPFGKKTATDSYGEAVKAIKQVSTFNTFMETKGNAITFTPEG